jgi:hypothetical protein
MKTRIQSFSAVSFAIAGLALLTSGCDSSSGPGGSDMDAMASQLGPKKPAAAPAEPSAGQPARPQPAPQPAPQPQTSATALPGGIATSADPDDLAGRAASHPAPPASPAPAQPAADAPAPHVPAVSRGEGDIVGKRVYTNHVGGELRYYGAIASARNFMEDRILDAQIQKTLQLWMADHGGNYPKTNDEYMEHIIKEGMIQLPELPPGQEYFYDPSDHELKVGTVVAPPTEGTTPADNQPAAGPAPPPSR